MNEHKAVPNIRFRNFKDEWTKKKISNFIIKNSDKNKNLVIKNIESISNKTGFTKQSEQFDGYRVASQDISNYYVISPNQFAYNPSRINVGSIAYKKKGEDKSIISPLYISFSTSSHINDSFLWFWFKTTSFKKQRIRFSEGGVRDTLPFENLKKMEISSPLLQEQKKIGNFFAKLDKLLDLQQQKIDKLELLKKTLLQKLFPKHDAKIPELRFKGFGGDWNEKRLNSITKRLDNYRKPITANKRLSGQTPYYGANGIQDYVKGYTHEGEFVLIAEDGANDVRNYPVRFVKGYIWVNNHAHVLQAKVGTSNNLFLAYSLKNRNLLPYLVGSGRMKLNADVLMNLLLKIPDLNEQQKIGNLLSKVDQLIELENKKLQNLEQVKKCLLQNMFVE